MKTNPLILFLLIFLILPAVLWAAQDGDAENIVRLEWTDEELPVIEKLLIHTSAQIESDEVGIACIPLHNDLWRNFFAMGTLNAGTGSLMGISDFAINPFYDIRYYPIEKIALSVSHHFAHLNIEDLTRTSGYPPVGPDAEFFSFLKAGVDLAMFVQKDPIVRDYYLGYTNNYFPFSETYFENKLFGIRAGYVHRLGGIDFNPLGIYFGDEDETRTIYNIRGNAYYHGAYLGLSYTKRRELEILYSISGGDVKGYYADVLSSHTLDIHYYPYAELDTNGGPMGVTLPIAIEYNIRTVVPMSKTFCSAFEMVLGAGPFTEPADGAEYDSEADVISNNVYFGIGLCLAYSNGL